MSFKEGCKVFVKCGDTYNNLTVLKEVDKIKNKRYIQCKCKCGTETIVRMDALLNGRTKSCGCMNKKNTKHGMSGKGIYSVWSTMMSRCYDEKDISYKNYGARGIKVCNEWQNMEKFISDMESSYQKGLSIDRINNDQNYSKENCKWSNRYEQSRNKRNNIWMELNGKKMILKDYCELTGTDYKLTRQNLLRRKKRNTNGNISKADQKHIDLLGQSDSKGLPRIITNTNAWIDRID